MQHFVDIIIVWGTPYGLDVIGFLSITMLFFSDYENVSDNVCCAVQCVDIVDTYGALIAHMIATEYTPEQICKVTATLFPVIAFVFG